MSGRWPRDLSGLLARATVAVNVRDAKNPADEPESVGTGFHISAGLVATAAHVVRLHDAGGNLRQARVSLLLYDGREVDVEVVSDSTYTDPEQAVSGDLAILRLPLSDVRLAAPYVMLARPAAYRDHVFVYGHPDGSFRNGKAAGVEYVAESLYFAESAPVRLGSLNGMSLGVGFSGSPALNMRTGAVCGMIVLGGENTTSSQMVPASTIMAALARLEPLRRDRPAVHPRWKRLLDDAQITAAEALIPGPRLRWYLYMTRRCAERHPYRGIVPEVEAPELSVVYRQQSVAGKVTEAVPAIGYLLRMHGDVVVVSGPSGAGKSSLLNMTALRAVSEWMGGRLCFRCSATVSA